MGLALALWIMIASAAMFAYVGRFAGSAQPKWKQPPADSDLPPAGDRNEVEPPRRPQNL